MGQAGQRPDLTLLLAKLLSNILSIWAARWMLDTFLEGPNVFIEHSYRVVLISCKVVVIKLALSPDVDG